MDTIADKQGRKWYAIWWDVWTHPGVTVFQTLERDENVSTKRGVIWVAVVAVVAYLCNFIITRVFMSKTTDFLELPIGYPICEITVGIISPTIGFVVSVAIYHWIAGRLGGHGNQEALTFCLAAIQAPYTLVSMLLGLANSSFLWSTAADLGSFGSTNATPWSPVTCLVSMIIMALGIYTIVLDVSAIRAVENLNTGKAVLTLFIPALVIISVFLCFSFVMFGILGTQL